jgi:hemoglobin/transferrin/lactoferrin receptor protein
LKLIVFFLLNLLILCSLSAKDVKIYDSRNGNPVEGVLIYSETSTTVTDKNGVANLDRFLPDEILIFRHASYLEFRTTLKSIELKGSVVLLVENPIKLDEVVVSANRRLQTQSEIPNKITAIPAIEILRNNPQTAADLLGSQGGIFIQKSQMGGGSPMIRGFSANRLLIVVDGIRMNNAIYRSGNLHNVISVDANSLETTEVIFGPGTVLYGSDAMGGVMSFNTLSPKFSASGKKFFSGSAMSRYSSANFEKTFHTDINFGTGRLAALFSATYSDFDDLRMGSSGPEEYLVPEYVSNKKFKGGDVIIQNKNPQKQYFTGYSQFNLMFKARYQLSESVGLIFSSHYSATSDIPRFDRLIMYAGNKLRYGNWYYGPMKWSLNSVQANFSEKNKLFDQATIIAGYQTYTESRYDRKLNNPKLNGREENLGIVTANFDFDKSFGKEMHLFYGAEGFYNDVKSVGKVTSLLTNLSEPAAGRYPENSNYESVAFYSSLKTNINKRLTFQSGARYTVTHLEGKFKNEYYSFPFDGFNNTNSALTGNIGLALHTETGWQVKLNGATGFRAPNLDDVAKVFDSEPGNVIVPNPDLKPEYARNIELDIIRTFSHKARFELNGFYTKLKNAMVRRDFLLNGQDSIMYDGELSKVEALVNAESATIYGGSFAFEFLFSNFLRTKHQINVTYGEDSEGKPVRHVPPTFGSSHLIFENKSLFIDLYANYNGELPYSRLEDSERDKPYMYASDKDGNPYSPSWWTLNLKANYKIAKGLILSGGVENILDKRYRPYSSGVVASGINFISSIRFDF